MKVKYLKGATNKSQYPLHDLPEIAFAGRSNAGKSSLLNSLASQSVAMVSKQPGKTRLLNFFESTQRDYRIVDLPGYGFAKRSLAEKKMWYKMIEEYLLERECLAAIVLVMDVRRSWDDDEEMMAQVCARRQIPMYLALTKIDKLNQKKTASRKKEHDQLGYLSGIHYISNTSGRGLRELEKSLIDIIKFTAPIIKNQNKLVEQEFSDDENTNTNDCAD